MSYKTVAFYSDNYGYSPLFDTKIRSAFLHGKLKGISILSSMIRGKSLSTLHQLTKEHSNAHIGLHFNLVEGKSVHKRSLIPSLVRKGGYFYPLWLFVILLFSRYIKRHHIERELSEQYNFLLKQGLRVDTIDSHHHIHALSPVSEIVTEFARNHSIRFTRSYNNIAAYTWSAKLKLFALKISAIISYFIAYKQFGLPESWRIPSSYRLSFLNWEGKALDLSKSSSSKILYCCIHPFLPFDSSASDKILQR